MQETLQSSVMVTYRDLWLLLPTAAVDYVALTSATDSQPPRQYHAAQ